MNPTRYTHQREWPGSRSSALAKAFQERTTTSLVSPLIIHTETRYNYRPVAFKHHTSKLTSFDDLAGIETYGFHGEALSPLYALYESITVTVAMPEGAPMATALEFDKWSGFSLVLARSLNRWNHSAHLSTQLMKLPVRDYVHTAIHSFPVRWKEFEPHAMLKFGEVPTLTSAYALVPCQRENGGIKPTLIQVPDTV